VGEFRRAGARSGPVGLSRGYGHISQLPTANTRPPGKLRLEDPWPDDPGPRGVRDQVWGRVRVGVPGRGPGAGSWGPGPGSGAGAGPGPGPGPGPGRGPGPGSGAGSGAGSGSRGRAGVRGPGRGPENGVRGPILAENQGFGPILGSGARFWGPGPDFGVRGPILGSGAGSWGPGTGSGVGARVGVPGRVRVGVPERPENPENWSKMVKNGQKWGGRKRGGKPGFRGKNWLRVLSGPPGFGWGGNRFCS